MGRDAYRALWGPLLRGKFGERADDVAMVWLQNKFRLRRGDDAAEEKLGYPKHSWELLFGALRDRIEAGGGRVLIDRPAAQASSPASSSPRARPNSFRRGHDPRDFETLEPERYDAVLATVPSDVFEQIARARRAARGLPGQAARDRVLHRALPADRARPPVLAVLLDQHRRRRAAVRGPDRAHEPDRARALRRPPLPLRRQLPAARARAARSRRRRPARALHARPEGGQPASSNAPGSSSCGCTASRPRSRSSPSATGTRSRP